jgi:hypothetical protein
MIKSKRAKSVLVAVTLIATGCTSQYSYHQVDDEYGYRKVVTSVSDTTKPAFSEPVMDYAAITATTLAVVAALGAMGAAE